MKFIKIAVLLVAFAMIMSGCSTSNTNTADQSTTQGRPENDKAASKSVDLKKVKDDILETLGASDYVEINSVAANLLYSIEEKDMKQCEGFSVANGTFPHEVVMIEAKNEDAAKRIEKALQTKIDSFAQQSKNYDADNYALAKKCKLEKNGLYFGLFLSPDYKEIKTVYNKYIK